MKKIFIENSFYRIEIEEKTGIITALILKELNYDLIQEKRLASNFRLCIPSKDYLGNYADGTKKAPAGFLKDGNTIKVLFSGVVSDLGELDVELEYSITLKDDYISFKAKVTNNSDMQISEFWFPRLGGLTDFNSNKDSSLNYPGYLSIEEKKVFRHFPGVRGLGAEASEFSCDYPGMVMPWWDIYDNNSDFGLYMGYHDTIFRYSTWHTYLIPNIARRNRTWPTAEEACFEPVGMVFSHVRYPFIGKGETFETGEFILRVHKGNWHYGSLFYREWFIKNFPFDHSKSWLRNMSAWFTSIIYQPEDRIVTDYEGYDQWCKDAEACGIDCHELIGWDKGGLERDYPEYVPEEKLGGREGFRKLLRSIDERGKKCLVFVNYNILDSCTEWYRKELNKYKHHDIYGNTPNWMAWGESTLLARKSINVRRHHLSSVVEPIIDTLEEYFLDLVRDGAHGFQIDKLCVGSTLDFNSLNKEKPDVALCEGLVKALADLYEKCREINPEFNMAAEAGQDRLIPYFSVYYRNSNSNKISPLRFVFPEWTSCQHIGVPYDYTGVNGAVLTGSVICVEPDAYQGSLNQPMWEKLGSYIKEIERIRNEIKEIIFTGKYYDTLGANVTWISSVNDKEKGKVMDIIGAEVMIPGGVNSSINENFGGLFYAVHSDLEDKVRAIVVINNGEKKAKYLWEFTHRPVKKAKLYSPFKSVRIVDVGTSLVIKPEGLHILVEER